MQRATAVLTSLLSVTSKDTLSTNNSSLNKPTQTAECNGMERTDMLCRIKEEEERWRMCSKYVDFQSDMCPHTAANKPNEQRPASPK